MLTRSFADDTLVVFLSDSHIGGDPGRDIFETPSDLAQLFDELAAQACPVELVLAGDFFDFLRIGIVPEGANRASQTIDRPEYAGLFSALRNFAAGEGRSVVYLPGNHDAEAWWNAEIRAELTQRGLVHEFALSYAAAFISAPHQFVYCEHGNEFDPSNFVHDYNDPLDTPLGDHIVTDLMPRLPRGRTSTALHLHDIDRVFPLTAIPYWLAGRLFYEIVGETLRWVVLPLLLAYGAYEAISFEFGFGRGALNALIAGVAYDLGILVVGFVAFLLVVRRIAHNGSDSAPPRLKQNIGPSQETDATVRKIKNLVMANRAPPLADRLDGEIRVFVSGHTHAPSLDRFTASDGRDIAVINSGCWLRQLRSTRTIFGAPEVFRSIFVQTHVRVYLKDGKINAELWSRPRPTASGLQFAEWAAIGGRLPAQPGVGGDASVIASISL